MDRYRRNRARSRELFALLADEAYYSQPIALRHPIVFYEGHLPGFSFNTLVKKALGGPSIDARLESLFARGIDPPESAAARSHPPSAQDQWPSREVVRAFAAEADRLVIEALQHADLDRPGHPLLDRSEAVFAILEHEEMHQETLRYMWHRLPFAQKTAPAGYRPRTGGAPAPVEWVHVPAGRATLGVDRTAIPFGWDNECPAWSVDVPGFSIERHDVTNERFLEFVEAGGYRDAAMVDGGRLAVASVRGAGASAVLGANRSGLVLARDVRIDPAAGVVAGVRQSRRKPPRSHDGAARASRRRASSSARPMDPRKANGAYPWGHDAPTPRHGVFDFASWDPEPAGSHPGRGQCVGRGGSRRQRMGVDEFGVRAVSGISRDRVVPRGTPPTSSTASISS